MHLALNKVGIFAKMQLILDYHTSLTSIAASTYLENQRRCCDKKSLIKTKKRKLSVSHVFVFLGCFFHSCCRKNNDALRSDRHIQPLRDRVQKYVGLCWMIQCCLSSTPRKQINPAHGQLSIGLPLVFLLCSVVYFFNFYTDYLVSTLFYTIFVYFQWPLAASCIVLS